MDFPLPFPLFPFPCQRHRLRTKPAKKYRNFNSFNTNLLHRIDCSKKVTTRRMDDVEMSVCSEPKARSPWKTLIRGEDLKSERPGSLWRFRSSPMCSCVHDLPSMKDQLIISYLMTLNFFHKQLQLTMSSWHHYKSYHRIWHVTSLHAQQGHPSHSPLAPHSHHTLHPIWVNDDGSPNFNDSRHVWKCSFPNYLWGSCHVLSLIVHPDSSSWSELVVWVDALEW